MRIRLAVQGGRALGRKAQAALADQFHGQGEYLPVADFLEPLLMFIGHLLKALKVFFQLVQGAGR